MPYGIANVIAETLAKYLRLIWGKAQSRVDALRKNIYPKCLKATLHTEWQERIYTVAIIRC